jgi:hypothetical protein
VQTIKLGLLYGMGIGIYLEKLRAKEARRIS